MKYRVKQKRNGINDKALYYAVPVWSKLIGTREIAQQLAKRSSFTPADIRTTLIGLVDVMESYLYDGYSVKLDDLGVFRLSATSAGYTKAKECTPYHVRVVKLCFRTNPQITKKLKLVKFERDK